LLKLKHLLPEKIRIDDVLSHGIVFRLATVFRRPLIPFQLSKWAIQVNIG
jgi:hypothetical protein